MKTTLGLTAGSAAASTANNEAAAHVKHQCIIRILIPP
jgi:hypothetical protein